MRTESSTRPVHLVYGVSSDTDLVELDKLHDYAKSLPQFTFDYCVSDPDSTAPNKGYVTGLIEPDHLDDGNVDVYLCGPPPMVEAVRLHFKDVSITPTNFYFEKFNNAAAPADSPAASAEESAAARTRSVKNICRSRSRTHSSTLGWPSNSEQWNSRSAASLRHS